MTIEIYRNTPAAKKLYEEKFKPLLLQGIIEIQPYHNVLDNFYDNLKIRYSQGTLGYIFKTDISNFFESIPKDEIAQACTELSNLIGISAQEIISICCIQKDRKIFIPVGYSTSSFLAEYIINKKINPAEKANIIRYVDDIIIFGPTVLGTRFKQSTEELVQLIKSTYFVNADWVTLKPEKTGYFTKRESIKFLGTIFKPINNAIYIPTKITGETGIKKYNGYAFKIAKAIREKDREVRSFNIGTLDTYSNLFTQKDFAILNGINSSTVYKIWFRDKVLYFLSKLTN